MWIQCVGDNIPGRPTVVMVAGLGANHNHWDNLFYQLDGRGRVCRYDRPGLGASPKRVGPVDITVAHHAHELLALLASAGITGPTVLVGHSYGGLVVRAAAAEQPTQVSALVLVDASYPSQWKDDERFWDEADTTIDMAVTETLTAGRPQLGSKPVFVITAGQGSDQTWFTEQEKMTQLSTNSTRVTVTNSEHNIMATNPEAVMAAITAIWDAATQHTPLGPCDEDAWTALASRCE